MYTSQDTTYEGQGRVNQLGGTFVNGRPLPNHIRMTIINMAKQGIRPSAISRELRVSHGCISKILTRYFETGLIEPGSVVNKSKSKVLTNDIKQNVIEYKNIHPENPNFNRQIRQPLLDDSVRLPTPLPSEKNFFTDEKSTDKTSKTRRHRTNFNHDQIGILEKCFQETPYPDIKARDKLSECTHLSEARIQVWFSNRRARWRKLISTERLQLSSTISSLPFSVGPINTSSLRIAEPAIQSFDLPFNREKPLTVLSNSTLQLSNECTNCINISNPGNLSNDQKALFYTRYANDYKHFYQPTETFLYSSPNVSGSTYSPAVSFSSSSSFYTPNTFNMQNVYL